VREVRVTVKLLCGNYWNAAIIETEDYEGDISGDVRQQVPGCEVRLAQQFDGRSRGAFETSGNCYPSLKARIFQIGSFRVQTKSKYGHPQICCPATGRCSCSYTLPANTEPSSKLHTKIRCDIWHAVRTTHCVPAVSKLITWFLKTRSVPLGSRLQTPAVSTSLVSLPLPAVSVQPLKLTP